MGPGRPVGAQSGGLGSGGAWRVESTRVGGAGRGRAEPRRWGWIWRLQKSWR